MKTSTDILTSMQNNGKWHIIKYFTIGHKYSTPETIQKSILSELLNKLWFIGMAIKRPGQVYWRLYEKLKMQDTIEHVQRGTHLGEI